jgi:hypothetical protein
MSNTTTAKKPTITKTFSYNPATGSEFDSTESCIKHLKTMINEDSMYVWLLEHQFYMLMKHSDGFDNELIFLGYKLYRIMNEIMVSLIDEPGPEA